MIVLINLKYEEKSITQFRRQEHLGLGYIASCAIKQGYPVKVINGQFDELEDQIIIKKVIQLQPIVLGLSLYEMQLNQAIGVLTQIKRKLPSLIVIVGGHFATFNAHAILKHITAVDMVVVGEGELAFASLLDEIKYKKSYYHTKGVVFKKDGHIIDNGFSNRVNDFDQLPYPVRQIKDRSRLITNISASRGCHGNCSLCSTNALDRAQRNFQIRTRDPLLVVNEIGLLVKKQCAYHFFFTDDNFLAAERISPGWIDIFCSEIKKNKLNIIFNFDCRVDDLNMEHLKSLKEVGLIGLFLGVESNSSKTLKLYNKSTTPRQNIEAIRLLRKLRIDYWIGNIMFHPLTNIDDIQADIDFFDEINYTLYFNYANPVSALAGKLKVYPGTSLCQKLMDRQKVNHDGLTYYYDFYDARVRVFYSFIERWRGNIKPLLELDTIFLIDVANKHKKNELSKKLHFLSRKYMKIDFQAFKEGLEYVKNHLNVPSMNEIFEKISSNKLIQLDEVYNQISMIKEILY